MGVTRLKGRYWQAQIRSGGTNHYLGIFKSAEEAHQAYLNAKERLHLEAPL